jgi:uncharacterized membrane protein
LVSHAFKFENGVLTDLRALPGVNSSYGSWITANGLVAGFSGNSEIDPLSGGPEGRAVFWNDGQIIDLGTFGGNAPTTSVRFFKPKGTWRGRSVTRSGR